MFTVLSDKTSFAFLSAMESNGALAVTGDDGMDGEVGLVSSLAYW